MTPQGGGGVIYIPGVKKLGYFYTFSAPKAPRKFFEHFCQIFGKFVNKNVVKSDFWGVICRYISKGLKK